MCLHTRLSAPRAIAEKLGYTKAVQAEGGSYSLTLLVQEDYDPDDRFKAFDVNEEDYLMVNGWLFCIDPV
jgi:hypothetical protein